MLPARSAQAGRRFVTSWLSGRTWLWNHEIGMARFDPGVFHFRDFFEPTDFVFVRPDDVVFARGRAARVDPPLFDPVMDRLLDDAELAGQVGNPPFVFLEQIVAKILTDQTHFPHQGADSYLAKAAAAVRWNEALGVEFGGDGCAVQSFPMKLFQSFLEASKVFQLLEAGDGPSHLVLGRHSAFPDDRHLG